MHFLQSPLPARRRPLSANEIAAIAVAVATACPAPRNVPGGLDRPRQVNGKSPRKQAGAVEECRFRSNPAGFSDLKSVTVPGPVTAKACILANYRKARGRRASGVALGGRRGPNLAHHTNRAIVDDRADQPQDRHLRPWDQSRVRINDREPTRGILIEADGQWPSRPNGWWQPGPECQPRRKPLRSGPAIFADDMPISCRRRAMARPRPHGSGLTSAMNGPGMVLIRPPPTIGSPSIARRASRQPPARLSEHWMHAVRVQAARRSSGDQPRRSYPSRERGVAGSRQTDPR